MDLIYPLAGDKLPIRKEQDKLYVFSAVVDPVNRDDSIEFYEVKNNQLIKIYSDKKKELNAKQKNLIKK